MASSPSYGERPPLQGYRRSFTVPARALSLLERAGLEHADANDETLYAHPDARIVAFDAPKGSIPVSPDRKVLPDTDYPVDVVDALPWRTRTETLVATGPMVIEKIRGSSYFLKSADQKVIHCILRNSQCWCVDGVSKFVLRRGELRYYRIELPCDTEAAQAKVEEFKAVLPKVLLYERTPCPFIRAFHVDLPDDAITPRRTGTWKRKSPTTSPGPESDPRPLHCAKNHRAWELQGRVASSPLHTYGRRGSDYGHSPSRTPPPLTPRDRRSHRSGTSSSLPSSEDGHEARNGEASSVDSGWEHDSGQEHHMPAEQKPEHAATDGNRHHEESHAVVENVPVTPVPHVEDGHSPSSKEQDGHSPSNDEQDDHSPSSEEQDDRSPSTEERDDDESKRRPPTPSDPASPSERPPRLPSSDSMAVPEELVLSDQASEREQEPLPNDHARDITPVVGLEHSAVEVNPAFAQLTAAPLDTAVANGPAEVDDLEPGPNKAHSQPTPQAALDSTLGGAPPSESTDADAAPDHETPQSSQVGAAAEILAEYAPQELEPQELEPQELEPQELEPQELEPQELEPVVEAPHQALESPEPHAIHQGPHDQSHDSVPSVLNTGDSDRLIGDQPAGLPSEDAWSQASSADTFHTTESITEPDMTGDREMIAAQRAAVAAAIGALSMTGPQHHRELSELTVIAAAIDHDGGIDGRPVSGGSLDRPSTPGLVRSSASDASWPDVSTPVSPEGEGLRRRLKGKRSLSPLSPAATLFPPGSSPHGSPFTRDLLRKACNLALVKPIEAVVLLVHILARIAGGATVNDLLSGDLFRRPDQHRRSSSFPDHISAPQDDTDEEDDFGVPLRGRRRAESLEVPSTTLQDDDAESLYDDLD